MLKRHSFLYFMYDQTSLRFTFRCKMGSHVTPFRPEEHGLSADFRLTNFTKLKG